MDRAFQSGAAGSAPTAPASPSIGYPTAGNPGTGTPATKPGPYWYHMIMEELMAIIGAAGITPAQGNLTQLLTALRSAGIFQTQAIGDRTTKGATTAFVQQEQGGFSGYSNIATSRALVASDIGQALWFSGAGFTLTLPTPTSLGIPSGKAVTVFGNAYTGAIVAGAGAFINFAGSNDGAITIKAGQTATFVAVSPTTWQVINSTAAMGKNADFAASFTVNGFQKLPSGFIEQFGYITTSASGDVNLVYPFTFPNGVLNVSAVYQNDAGSNPALASIGTMTTSSVNVGGYNPSTTARVGSQIRVRIIGW